MSIIKDSAVVLRVFEQSNTSQVVVFLAKRFGQIRVHVKGGRRWTKRGFAGGFDLLVFGELLAYSRPNGQLWIFKEWHERERPLRRLGMDFFPDHKKMKKISPTAPLYAASFMCELTEVLTRPGAGAHVAAPSAITVGLSAEADLYATLHFMLEGYGNLLPAFHPVGLLALIFAMEALAAGGATPDFTVCTRCETALVQAAAKRQTAAGAYFCHAGLVCSECLLQIGTSRLQMGSACGERLKADDATGLLRLGAKCFSEHWEADADNLTPAEKTGRQKPSTATSELLKISSEQIPFTPGWLSLEALATMEYVRRTRKSVKLSRRAAQAASLLLKPLLHVGLGQDLKTCDHLAALIRKAAE
jgi:recombinational DNA repair protein (RecF pathway)